MDLSRLNIAGDWHNDAATLEKFSRDMSAYRILPALGGGTEDRRRRSQDRPVYPE